MGRMLLPFVLQFTNVAKRKVPAIQRKRRSESASLRFRR
jgi:hypothetical protein